MNPSRRTIILLALMAWLLLAGLPHTVVANAPDRGANELFLRGLKLYEKKQYPAALRKYQQAYKLFPSPQIQFNMALVREKMRQPHKAAVHYERFLLKSDSRVFPRRVKAARAKLKLLRKKLATVSVACKVKGAAVVVDGEPAGLTPLAHRIYHRPGKMVLTVKGKGFGPYRKKLTLGAGKHRKLVVSLEPLPTRDAVVTAPPAPASKPVVRPDLVPGKGQGQRPHGEPPFYLKWWFWTAVGVVAAGVTVGVVASQTGGSDRVPAGELGSFNH